MKLNYFFQPLLEELKPESSATILIEGLEIETSVPKVDDVDDDDPSKIIPPTVEKTDEEETKPATRTSGEVLQIEVDGVTSDYIIDEAGNATKDGVIVYTAEALGELENSSDDDDSLVIDDNIHKLISEVSGINLVDSENKPLIFKAGLEGLAEREVVVKELFYNQGKEEALTDIFTNNPDLYEMYSYKLKHGSLDNYSNQVNYKTLELTETTSVDILKSIIKDYYLSIGNDEKTVDRIVKLSENEETLQSDALEALTKLKDNQATKETLSIQQAKQAEQAEIAKIENYYGVSYNGKGELIDKGVKGSVYDKIVKEGKIGNIMIPNDGLIIDKNNTKTRLTRNNIFSYFYEPIKQSDGTYLSQAQIDEHNRISDTDNYLIQGIRNLTGGDLKSLEKAMENVINLKGAKKLIRVVTKSQQQASSNKTLDAQLQSGTAHVVIN